MNNDVPNTELELIVLTALRRESLKTGFGKISVEVDYKDDRAVHLNVINKTSYSLESFWERNPRGIDSQGC